MMARPVFILVAFALLCTPPDAAAAAAHTVDVSRACICRPSRPCSRPDASSAVIARREVARIAGWLADEVASRIDNGWEQDSCDCANHSGGGGATVVLTIVGAGEISPCGSLPPAAGSFLLQTAGRRLQLQAVDVAGLQSGAGRLLRELRMPARGAGAGAISVPAELCVRHDGARELWRVRGHQISCNANGPMQLR